MKTLRNIAQIIHTNSQTIHHTNAHVRTEPTANLEQVNMDVLQIVEDPTTQNGLIGVFHVSKGRLNELDSNLNANHSWLFLATTTTSSLNSWSTLNDGNPYSQAGSMGYIYQDLNSDTVYLAYELESSGGNQIAIRKYQSMTDLIQNNQFEEEWFTGRLVDGDTVQNIGTPTIEAVDSSAIYFTFHYQMNSSAEDRPGRGILLFDGNDVKTSCITIKQNQIADSFAEASVAGKIGGRDSVVIGGRQIYFYEAQLSQDTSNLDSQERWRSWRTFLYAPGFEMNQVTLLNLVIQGSSTFANPRSAVIGDKLYMTFFVPSERVGSLGAGTILFEVPMTAFD